MQKITAIQLRREHRGPQQDAVVRIEVNGIWMEVIREPVGSNFSHIIEESGLRQVIAFHCDEQSTNDLVDSGGIVDAP